LVVLAIVGCCLVGGLAIGITMLRSRSGGTTETEVTQRQTASFDVGFRPSVTITDVAGNVSVNPGPDGKVSVQATKRVANGPNAERILSGLQVNMVKGENAVTIETRGPSATPSASTPRPTSSSTSPTVDLALTVPVATQLTVEVGAGAVTIQRIAGQMRVTTISGAITVQDAVFAGASQFTTTTGDVTLDGEMVSASLLGAQAQTGRIALTLPAVFSGHLDARTDAGAVTVKGWSVPVTAVNGTGQQAVGDLRQESSDYITLRVTTGDITVAPR
jgi:hypothetical protein